MRFESNDFNRHSRDLSRFDKTFKTKMADLKKKNQLTGRGRGASVSSKGHADYEAI